MATKFIMKSTTSYFKFNGTTYYLTDLSYNEAYNKIDVTTTDTSGDGNEFISGRAERSFTVDILNDVSGSDLQLNLAAECTASFEGKEYRGNATLYTKNVVGSIDDSIKSSYEGSMNGSVSITNVA